MIELRAGDLRLLLDPKTGGAIAAFERGGEALFRPVADPRLAAQHGRAVAAYPLVPFANRIAWGRFSVDGTEYQLVRNFGDHPHTIHGNGWMRAWTVEAEDSGAATLALVHAPPADPVAQWPFRYRARLRYALTEAGLAVTLALTNEDARRFPAGLGLHPYLALRSGTALRFRAPSYWENDANALPAARHAASGLFDFSHGRVVGDPPVDNCFDGWDERAEIDWPGAGGLAVAADTPFRHLQLYAPPGGDFFGLEPVTHMPDAVNRPEVDGSGYRMLDPGESLSGTVRFEVS